MNYNTERYQSLPEIAIKLRDYRLLICFHPTPPIISSCTFMGSTARDIPTYLTYTTFENPVHSQTLLLSLNKET